MYSTYLGGGYGDKGYGIAVDSAHFTYVTGVAGSEDFPVLNHLQSHIGTDGTNDAFIAKIAPDGSSLVYSTCLGGHGEDQADDIAVDQEGAVYVTGTTFASDFPSQGAIFGVCGGGDGFVTKLAPSGQTLEYSTYIGGSGWDQAFAIAVDSHGAAYITGRTSSSDFPLVNAYDDTIGVSVGVHVEWDAFVCKISETGRSLVYSTYVGADGNDEGHAIAVDDSGSAYVAGEVSHYWTNDFPEIEAALAYQGESDIPSAFVIKFDPTGKTLKYSTTLEQRGH